MPVAETHESGSLRATEGRPRGGIHVTQSVSATGWWAMRIMAGFRRGHPRETENLKN